MKTRNLLIGTLAATALLFSCSPKADTEQATAETEVVTEEVAATPEEATEENIEAEVIQLNQIPGEFTNGNLTLEVGTYKFEVANSGVDHEVGLVVAPKKEEITEADHIQNAYVTETVKDGESQQCKGDVVLEKGEYVYFCPLNPTEQYIITVE